MYTDLEFTQNNKTHWNVESFDDWSEIPLPIQLMKSTRKMMLQTPLPAMPLGLSLLYDNIWQNMPFVAELRIQQIPFYG